MKVVQACPLDVFIFQPRRFQLTSPLHFHLCPDSFDSQLIQSTYLASRVMFLSIIISVSLLYAFRVAFRVLRHRAIARKTGLPYIIFPVSEQNLLYQTVAETRLFPYVVNNWLPQALADYINATIFRFRWNVKDRMRKKYGGVYLVVTPSTLTCNVDDASVASQVCMARHSFPKPVEKYGKWSYLSV